MEWLKRFLGLNDKKQKQKAQEVSEYVHDKKNEFTSTMINAHRETQENKKELKKQKRNTVKIRTKILDINKQIYLITGNRI